MIFFVFLEVSHICGHEVFPSWWRILELNEGPAYTQWNFDWPLLLSRDASMYSRRCLHSSMIGMPCTASWGPSRTIQTALRCPHPESSALTPHWTGCGLCFVVDLVEEHVDLGGSQFSESILERLYSAHASQWNVVTLEFGSPGSSRSALFARDLIRHSYNGLPRSLTKRSVFNVESHAFMTRTCLETVWHIFCVCFNNGLPSSVMCHFNVETLAVIRWTCLGFSRFDNGLPRSLWRDSLFVKRIYIDLLGTGRASSILHGSHVSPT